LSFITTFPDLLRVSKFMIYLNILYYLFHPLWILESYSKYKYSKKSEGLYRENNIVRISKPFGRKGSKVYYFKRRIRV